MRRFLQLYVDALWQVSKFIVFALSFSASVVLAILLFYRLLQLAWWIGILYGVVLISGVLALARWHSERETAKYGEERDFLL